MNDLKFAFRQLRKNPGFTAVAVLTLALGLGANTAIFQLLNGVRLKTLPVSRPQELIEARMVGGNPGIGISDGANAEMTYPLWDQLQNHREAFSGLFAWSSGDLPIGNDVETRMVRGLWTSGEFFSVLGVAPFRGRLIQADDDRRGAGPGGVVISYAFWQSEFGGQVSAIGKSLTLGDRVLQIIGVFLSTQGNRLDLDLDTDWRVIAFTSAVAVLTCVFVGLTPAIRSTRMHPAAALSAGGRGMAGNRERFALQRGLAVLQMAVSLVLLSGALLLVRIRYE